MEHPPLADRLIRPRLLEAPADTPVVLVHRPRQCGKTALAKTIPDYAYSTFDDAIRLAAAKVDTVAVVARGIVPVSRRWYSVTFAHWRASFRSISCCDWPPGSGRDY